MSWPHRRARVLLACWSLAVSVGIGPGIEVMSAAAATPHRALVIVETGANRYVRTITFDSESVSGIRALELAGADPVVSTYAGQGGAVCRLFGVGRDAGPDCLGGADGDNRYWAYFRASAGTSSFTYARSGAGSVQVRDGDVEGWRFGTGQAPTYEALPPVTTTTTAPPTTTTTVAGGSAGGGGAGGGTDGGTGGRPIGGSSATGATGDPAANTGGPTNTAGAGPVAAASSESTKSNGLAGDSTVEVRGRTTSRPGDSTDAIGGRRALGAPGRSDVADAGTALGTLIGFGVAIALLVGLAVVLQRGRGRTLGVE